MLRLGGWFLLGDSAKGYSNKTFIEMAYNLIVNGSKPPWTITRTTKTPIKTLDKGREVQP